MYIFCNICIYSGNDGYGNTEKINILKFVLVTTLIVNSAKSKLLAMPKKKQLTKKSSKQLGIETSRPYSL